jgi:lipoate-protein ligase A
MQNMEMNDLVIGLVSGQKVRLMQKVVKQLGLQGMSMLVDMQYAMLQQVLMNRI